MLVRLLANPFHYRWQFVWLHHSYRLNQQLLAHNILCSPNKTKGLSIYVAMTMSCHYCIHSWATVTSQLLKSSGSVCDRDQNWIKWSKPFLEGIKVTSKLLKLMVQESMGAIWPLTFDLWKWSNQDWQEAQKGESVKNGITFNWLWTLPIQAHAIAIQWGSSVTVMCCRGTTNIGPTLNSCPIARTKEHCGP